MSVTNLRCKSCYKEFEYSECITCDNCKQKISAKQCIDCHNKSCSARKIMHPFGVKIYSHYRYIILGFLILYTYTQIGATLL